MYVDLNPETAQKFDLNMAGFVTPAYYGNELIRAPNSLYTGKGSIQYLEKGTYRPFDTPNQYYGTEDTVYGKGEKVDDPSVYDDVRNYDISAIDVATWNELQINHTDYYTRLCAHRWITKEDTEKIESCDEAQRRAFAYETAQSGICEGADLLPIVGETCRGVEVLIDEAKGTEQGRYEAQYAGTNAGIDAAVDVTTYGLAKGAATLGKFGARVLGTGAKVLGDGAEVAREAGPEVTHTVGKGVGLADSVKSFLGVARASEAAERVAKEAAAATEQAAKDAAEQAAKDAADQAAKRAQAARDTPLTPAEQEQVDKVTRQEQAYKLKQEKAIRLIKLQTGQMEDAKLVAEYENADKLLSDTTLERDRDLATAYKTHPEDWDDLYDTMKQRDELEIHKARRAARKAARMAAREADREADEEAAKLAAKERQLALQAAANAAVGVTGILGTPGSGPDWRDVPTDDTPTLPSKPTADFTPDWVDAHTPTPIATTESTTDGSGLMGSLLLLVIVIGGVYISYRFVRREFR